MEEFENGESCVQSINTLIVCIIEHSDHTNVMCALIKLLYETAGSPTPSHCFTELVMKCVWKVVKMLPSWEAETDFDMVLYDIHLFLKDFPLSSWKKQLSDTPVQIIKTILHCMTKIKGYKILSHLSRIDNLNEPELQSYLIELVKTVKHESSPPKRESKSQHRLSKNTHELLSEIFKKIGLKDRTKEIYSGGEDSDSSLGSKNALYYLERLRVLQQQAGLDPSACLLDSKQQGPSDKDDNELNGENLNKKPALDDRPEGFVSVQHSSSNRGVSGVDALRKCLEVLKGSTR